MAQSTWETEETILWLAKTDEATYLATLNMSASQLKDFVGQGLAPKGLYESFRNHNGHAERINWNAVAAACRP